MKLTLLAIAVICIWLTGVLYLVDWHKANYVRIDGIELNEYTEDVSDIVVDRVAVYWIDNKTVRVSLVSEGKELGMYHNESPEWMRWVRDSGLSNAHAADIVKKYGMTPSFDVFINFPYDDGTRNTPGIITMPSEQSGSLHGFDKDGTLIMPHYGQGNMEATDLSSSESRYISLPDAKGQYCEFLQTGEATQKIELHDGTIYIKKDGLWLLSEMGKAPKKLSSTLIVKVDARLLNGNHVQMTVTMEDGSKHGPYGYIVGNERDYSREGIESFVDLLYDWEWSEENEIVLNQGND